MALFVKKIGVSSVAMRKGLRVHTINGVIEIGVLMALHDVQATTIVSNRRIVEPAYVMLLFVNLIMSERLSTTLVQRQSRRVIPRQAVIVVH